MKEAENLVSRIIEDITGDPSCYSITSSLDENGALLTLEISDKWAGRVIGKDGKTAMAIRQILYALGHKNGAHYSLKIFNPSQHVSSI